MGCTDSKEKKPEPPKKAEVTAKTEPTSPQKKAVDDEEKKRKAAASEAEKQQKPKVPKSSSKRDLGALNPLAQAGTPNHTPAPPPKPHLWGFFPGAGGAIDLLRAATTTKVGSGDYSQLAESIANPELDLSSTLNSSLLLPLAANHSDNTDSDVTPSSISPSSHTQNSRFPIPPSLTASFDYILNDLKLIEGHRGENAANVTDKELKEMIESTSKEILSEVSLIDISFCNKLSVQAISSLFSACMNDGLRAVYAFPAPTISSSSNKTDNNNNNNNTATAAATLFSRESQFKLPKTIKILCVHTDENRIKANLIKHCQDVTSRNKKCALNWTSLGGCLARNPDLRQAKVDGKLYTAQACFHEAIAIKNPESNCRRAWYELGILLEEDQDEGIDQQQHDSLSCFVNSVLCDPECSFSWQGLGSDLLLKNDVANNNNSNADFQQQHQQLSSASFDQQSAASVKVFNNEPEFTARDCFVKALQLNKDNVFAWANIARTLPNTADEKSSTATVRISLQEFNKIQCLTRALELDPDNSVATWNNLGAVLSHLSSETQQKTTAISGKKYNARDCFIKAIQMANGDYGTAWYNLSKELNDDDETVEVKFESLVLKPKNDDQEEQDNNNNETPDEEPPQTSFTRLECMIKAVEANPDLKKAWRDLAMRFSDDATELDALVINGEEYSKIDVLRKAL